EGPMNELGRRHQSNVLRLVVRAVLNATCDGHVELARKVRKFRIAAGAYNRPVEVNHNGCRIQQFSRPQACQSTAIDIPHIVLARLRRTQIDAAQSLKNFWDALDRVSAQLNLLAG